MKKEKKEMQRVLQCRCCVLERVMHACVFWCPITALLHVQLIEISLILVITGMCFSAFSELMCLRPLAGVCVCVRVCVCVC